MSDFEPAPLELATRLSWYPWLIIGTTCIGAFIGQLDASIVQLALPALEREFGVSVNAVSWVAIGYSLAFAAILPLFARASEIFGRKAPCMAGYAMFALASALCGMAPNLGTLIAFRIVQGAGGALVGANSITILVKAAGPARRGRAMGILATAQAIGVSSGPIVGGVLLAMSGWRSIFWVTVPFGLLAAVLSWMVFPKTTNPAREQRLDWPGALLLMPSLTLIVLVLSKVQAWGITSPILISAVLATMILLPSFVARERRTNAPLLDLRLFRNAAFSGGVIAVSLSYALLYSMFFLMSFAFVRGFRESPIASGSRLAIIPIALGLVAPISGAFCDRLGVRMLTATGMASCIAGIALLPAGLAGVTGHAADLIIALALFGIGLGMFIAPNNSATIAAAPDHLSGEAGGLLNLARVLGGTIGVAVASTALSWRLEALTGNGRRTIGVPPEVLFGAVSEVLWVLGAFAVVAAVAALLRGPTKPKFSPGFQESARTGPAPAGMRGGMISGN
ncbi:MAG TPA: DHA2 family efflux MFS transporter permease subunit [Acidobacteriaceae bacterium]|nr:DHA2 family efflux MFS transporter permease subunit [Acidobacteriaceae bacterium]